MTDDQLASAIYVASPWRAKLPFPGPVTDGDLVQLGFHYRGFVSGDDDGGGRKWIGKILNVGHLINRI